MEVITSLDNKKIKNYAKLLEKKYRDEEGLFIIESEHLVLEAYKNNLLKEVILVEDYDIDIDVNKTYVTYEVLKKLCSTKTPQGIVGICKKMENKDINGNVLLLDNIQDPGNLGTIIRSCVAFNIDTIILSNDTVDLYNDKVIRSSEGMIFNINIIKSDLKESINYLKNNNYKIYGTKVDGGSVLKNIEFTNKSAIIMGNEGKGVNKDLLSLCDEYLYIPMNSKCESLNVGVATSIILYELGR